MHTKTIKELSALLHAKQVSRHRTGPPLPRPHRRRSDLNAFLHVDAALTLAQAAAADARIAEGDAGPLTGMPIAHKDIFVTRGWRSTAGSKMLANYVSPFDATVVEQFSAAGMVTLGKLNCDEFAMGSSNENSAFGPVKNPWDELAVPGGSSGGSAAAIAARLAPAATATDTGGSIRQPAALLRRHRHQADLWPRVALRHDRVRLLARPGRPDGADRRRLRPAAERDGRLRCARLDQPRPSRAPARRFHARPGQQPLHGLRIGVPQRILRRRPGGRRRSRPCAPRSAEFVKLGATLVDISLPKTALSIPVYYIIAPAEASSNLSRFDGVRYGHRAAEYKDLADMYGRPAPKASAREVQRRILVGTYVLCHGYYDAYYLQAQKIRRLIADDFQAGVRASAT